METSAVDIRYLAHVELQRTDWKLLRALERAFASAEWCDWRDAMREIASHPEGRTEPLPPEPPFSGAPNFSGAPKTIPFDLSAKLSDYAPAAEITTNDLLAADEATATAMVETMTRLQRKRFFELFNVELAELQQERGGPRENLEREREIESLLGMFARVGEM